MIKALNVPKFFIWTFTIAFLAYCFHFNVDLSDESFYLYFFQQGPEAVTFNFYHLFIHPIGELFGHQLLGYRYLSLMTILGASFLLGYAVAPNQRSVRYGISSALGLMYFNFISTFSYNTMVLVTGSSVLGLTLLLSKRDWKKTIATLIGLSSFLMFSARPGAGVIFLIGAIFALFLDSKDFKRIWFWPLLGFMIPLGFVLLFWNEKFAEMLEIIRVISKSSHEGIILNYLGQMGRFFLRSFLPPFLILVLGRKFTRNLLFIYFIWITGKYIVFEYDYQTFAYYLVGLVAAEIVLKLKHSPNKDVLLNYVLPLGLFIISSLGTNNNLIKTSAYNILLLLPVFFHLYFDHQTQLKKNAIAYFSIAMVILSVFKTQYMHYYRSEPRENQRYVKSQNRFLKGMWVDEKIEKELMEENFKLNSYGFNSKVDKIFAYPDIPGSVAFMGAKALGTPWMISGYKNADETNCFYLAKNNSREGKLFLIIKSSLSDSLKKCLDQSLLDKQVINI